MNCPYCHNPKTTVENSRPKCDDLIVERKRECTKCRKRFTTVEHITMPQAANRLGEYRYAHTSRKQK